MAEFVAILDFGSQYTQLIARRVREHRVYCEILPHTIRAEELKRREPLGIILSGGPAGVYESEAPRCDPAVLELGVPVLGICYGMQLACGLAGGKVAPARAREFGAAELEITAEDPLFAGMGRRTAVWMSHGDQVEALPPGFEGIARTPTCPFAAVRNLRTGFRGLQFHPEVTHTIEGRRIIGNFLYEICRLRGDWSLSRFTEEKIRELREEIGSSGVVCALSGGVDSSVLALLLHRAVGDRLHCIFVDNGLLRSGEREQVERTFRSHFGLDLRVADASARFLEALRGVTDPEEKRIRIGHLFIDVFKEEARALKDVEFLAQGTLYPDVIESRSPTGGPSATIKSHHNVGGLPAELGFRLVEPLRYLFKDEVRRIGSELGLPDQIVHRQPFPGPGLAVRIAGEVTPERLEILRHADRIVQEEMERFESYRDIWQSFAVLLPVRTVGVMGDRRTYQYAVALRIVESTDGMTANWVYLPRDILSRIANRIANEVEGVNRVTLDISSKPPSTIEWE